MPITLRGSRSGSSQRHSTAQLDYWKRQLAGLPEPCALPTDFDRPMPPYVPRRQIGHSVIRRVDQVAEKLEPPAKRHDVHDALRDV